MDYNVLNKRISEILINELVQEINVKIQWKKDQLAKKRKERNVAIFTAILIMIAIPTIYVIVWGFLHGCYH